MFSGWIIVNFLPRLLWSQEETYPLDSLLISDLSTIEVTATRLGQQDFKTTQAISTIGLTNIQMAQPQLTLNESLVYTPGVFALNANNFAQDLRVSIRGYGARAAFGIRGIKVLVDGIPETTPDGQSQVDNIDMGLIDRMEVIRGPSAGLYGNAAGGVISINTENPSGAPYAEARAMLGDYGLQRYQIKTGAKYGKWGYVIQNSYTNYDGFREQSKVINNLLSAKVTRALPKKGQFTLIFNYLDSPQADDPGGVTIDQALDQPSTARDRNISFDAGETISQNKIGAVFHQPLDDQHDLDASIYYIRRSFESTLPFETSGYVAFERDYYGGSVSHLWKNTKEHYQVKLKSGLDFQSQQDDRTRFDNLSGEKGDQRLDQNEIFSNLGIFHLQEWQFNRWILNGAIRFDVINIEAEDAFLSDGDDSGSQTLTSLNPSVGVNYELNDQTFLALNVATNFETPTLNELSTNPTGTGGFNEELSPQKSINYEAGIKGYLAKKLKYQLALFQIFLTDELIAYELPDFPDRTFFRNAGDSQRRGIEASIQYNLIEGLNVYANYTYSDFTFEDFIVEDEDFSGKLLPGIPQHQGFLGLNYLGTKGLFLSMNASFIGELYANNTNTVSDESYTLVNFRASYDWDIAKWTLSPFFGVNNLFNTRYESNIRINAFGNRFFEPGPDLQIFGGLKVRISSGK